MPKPRLRKRKQWISYEQRSCTRTGLRLREGNDYQPPGRPCGILQYPIPNPKVSPLSIQTHGPLSIPSKCALNPRKPPVGAFVDKPNVHSTGCVTQCHKQKWAFWVILQCVFLWTKGCENTWQLIKQFQFEPIPISVYQTLVQNFWAPSKGHLHHHVCMVFSLLEVLGKEVMYFGCALLWL